MVPLSITSIVENPEIGNGYDDIVADHELLECNRRALDTALAWLHLPGGMAKMEAVEKMANDVVDYLTGRVLTLLPPPPPPPLRHQPRLLGIPSVTALPRQLPCSHPSHNVYTLGTKI
ncbi:hypothetical protein Syun_022974 [Stephania yunnanensis]|uniref:Uncharacterized protein n=1 Tax=Stephania yunnanensis TaxID=152371 RepID=A0AAP0HZ36_9MAGN